MLERALTTQVCSQIVSMLVSRRGWSISRIARTIGGSTDYVRRVELRKQSFQMADVEALASAIKEAPHRLIFDSFDRDKLDPDLRGLYDLTRAEVERHDEFKRVLTRKPLVKRRRPTKAA